VKFRQTTEQAWRSPAAAVAGQAVHRPVGVETEDLPAVDAERGMRPSPTSNCSGSPTGCRRPHPTARWCHRQL